MALWTWFGLREGNASTAWSGGESSPAGQDSVLGMPRYDPTRCAPDCDRCVDACITHAISFAAGAPVTSTDRAEKPLSGDTTDKRTPMVDWGKCIVCQRCTEVCPTAAFTESNDWAVAVRKRDDLVLAQPSSEAVRHGALPMGSQTGRAFRRSLHIRHIDAGSCNGCESELQALNNPFYNLHRLGIFFTASPRAADVLLVTGSVTHAMKATLLETWNAMPDPKWVIATGTCAVSGGVSAGNYACGNGLEGVLPVDIYLPGCPPNPSAMIHSLLLLQDRASQRMKGGRIER